MLPKKLQFYCFNLSGVTLAPGSVVIGYAPWKKIKEDQVVCGAEQVKTNAAAIDTATGAFVGTAPVIDNTTDLNHGAHVRISVTTTGTPEGPVYIYAVKSNNGTDYESPRAQTAEIALQVHLVAGTLVHIVEV